MSQTVELATCARGLIAAVFNLDDPGERFIVEVLHRFHEDGLYQALALRRTLNANRERVIVELARIGGHPYKWDVIYWNQDEVSVRFHPCQDLQEAMVAYNTEPLAGQGSLLRGS